ncbi:MAG: serine/threonine-protein kinase [Myxococcales bacterium]
MPERQLKLAVLSVEKKLVTAEQVLGAVSLWVTDPSQTLPQCLERIGAINAETREQLESEAMQHSLGGDDQTLVSSSRGIPSSAESPSARMTLVTPECPDRYEFKGEHGKGGQAKVYVTLDRHLGREVAWKELSREASREPRDSSSQAATNLDRFLREARVTGQLEHPSIVPVYELGRRPDGAFYYTMRLVQGRTLSAAVKGAKDLSERLRLLGHFRDVCHALAFAHSRGIIHRDVKPANVMVGAFGETVVLDWGIAKIRGKDDVRSQELEQRMKSLSQDTSGQTLAGDALGTPSYMSPEQAEGRVEDVDERSDVWGLGGLLYELLTGHPPFLGTTALATLTLVSREPLVPVRTRESAAPPELAAIAEKALSKRRDQRYQSAAEVAADVTAYMAGLRVAAYAYSSWELLRRFASRYKALLGALSAVFVATVLALISTQAALTKESAARAREQEARVSEAAQRRVARYHLAQGYAREAERLADERQGLAARLFAAASLQQNPAHPASLDPDPAFAAQEPAAAWLRVDALSLLFQTRSHRVEKLLKALPMTEAVYRAAFSPDGRLLAACDFGGQLNVWRTDGFEPVMSVQAGSSLRALAFTPDSRLVLTGGADQSVKFWDPASRTPVRILTDAASSAIAALAVSPSGQLVAVGEHSGQLSLWDLVSGKPTRLAPAHAEMVRDLAFSPDGTLLGSASWDKSAFVWDVAARSRRFGLTGHTDGLYGLAFSPDGTQLATAAYDRTVRLWSAATGAALASLDTRNEAFAVAFSPTGHVLASADSAGVLRLFDAWTRMPEAAVRAHGSTGAVSLSFHPGGRLLASSGTDKSVRLWALATEGGVPRLAHEDWVYGLAWSNDGKVLATGSWDRKVRLWDAGTHQLLRTLTGHEAGLMHLALSPDGRLLASSSFDATVRLWAVPSGDTVRTLASGRGLVRFADFSPDGRLVAAAANDSAALIFDAQTGELKATLEHTPGMAVFGVAFSPDGRRLATSGQEKRVRLWDTATWTEVRRLEGHSDWSSGLAWSPDGKLLATTGKDAQVLLWEPETGRLLSRLEGHDKWVDDATFSPDGKLLASSGEDSRVVVWDVATRSPLLRLRTARETQRSRFSPDSRKLAVADHFDVAIYDLDLPFTVSDPAALLEQTRRAAGLELEGFSTSIAAP